MAPPEPFLVPFGARTDGRGTKPGAGENDRICLVCGTSAPPDDTFCTNCGRALLPIAETRSRRAWAIGPASDRPAWLRLPVWLYGIAAVVAVVVVVGGLILLLPGPAPAPPVAGTPFDGDGYGLVIPSAYQWIHADVPAGDDWVVQPVGAPGKSIQVTLVTDLAPAEQSIEGALGRMESGIPLARRPVIGAPQAITLPAGRAYRVVDSGGYDTYILFKDGRAVLVGFHNLSQAEEDAVAVSITLK